MKLSRLVEVAPPLMNGLDRAELSKLCNSSACWEDTVVVEEEAEAATEEPKASCVGEVE